MGESIVEAPSVENKMRGSLASGATLEVSVSFGRFENDSLSWEKWSSFSPNKYLEEVEKCSTPGSVAQKKAYFEAHYKKIAAQKAEQLEVEKQMETNGLTKDDQNGGDQVVKITNSMSLVSSSCSDDSNVSAAFTMECQSSSGKGDNEEMDAMLESLELRKLEEAVFVQEDTHLNEYQEKVENDEMETKSESLELNKSEESVYLQEDTHLNRVQEKLGKEEMDAIPESLELNKAEEPVFVQEDTHLNGFQEKVLPPFLVQEDTRPNGSQNKLKLPRNLLEGTGKNPENKKENVKLNAPNRFRKKIAPSKKESLAGTKKKLASPLPEKSPEISTQKTSKPILTSAVMSASWSSTKKGNSSLVTSNNYISVGGSKKVAPSSLHMSLSLGPANSDSTSPTKTRNSLIMEKMGDKDIVKRAFKTFQKNFNQERACSDAGSSGRKKVLTRRPEEKSFTYLTPRNVNEGLKTTKKMAVRRAPLERSCSTTLARSLKGDGMDQRTEKHSPSSFGLRSDERAEKRKEYFKKLQEKSYSDKSEKTRLTSKSKAEKEAENKKLRQSLNFKATPMPNFYWGQVISKNSIDKEGANYECRH